MAENAACCGARSGSQTQPDAPLVSPSTHTPSMEMTPQQVGSGVSPSPSGPGAGGWGPSLGTPSPARLPVPPRTRRCPPRGEESWGERSQQRAAQGTPRPCLPHGAPQRDFGGITVCCGHTDGLPGLRDTPGIPPGRTRPSPQREPWSPPTVCSWSPMASLGRSPIQGDAASTLPGPPPPGLWLGTGTAVPPGEHRIGPSLCHRDRPDPWPWQGTALLAPPPSCQTALPGASRTEGTLGPGTGPTDEPQARRQQRRHRALKSWVCTAGKGRGPRATASPWPLPEGCAPAPPTSAGRERSGSSWLQDALGPNQPITQQKSLPALAPASRGGTADRQEKFRDFADFSTTARRQAQTLVFKLFAIGI